MTKVAIPAVSASVGAAGILLARTKLQGNRKVLGVPAPKSKIDLGGLAQQVSEAGRQFGKLAREVQAVREKAQEVGRIIS